MFQVSPDFLDNTAPKVATVLSALVVLLFGVYAFWYSKKKASLESHTLENFLTARNSMGWLNIGWSFYASAMGAWVITGPAEFGYYGGILGVFAYSFASSIPILMIAFFGAKMRSSYPSLLSLSDFVLWRFGRMTQVLVVLVSLLNMSIAITAEYTTLSSFYADFVGLQDFTFLIIVLVAAVTLTYTAYGGLKASIITDRAQAAVSLFLVQVVVIYLFADFTQEEIAEEIEEQGFNSSFEFTDALKGFNASGFSSLFTLPFSLMTATIFSEAIWQRSWAAIDQEVLNKGALMGALLIFLVVAFFGSIGVLVAWANLVEDPFSFNSNLFVFQAFTREAFSPVVSSGIGILVLLLGTIMSEGAIDSLQNGIGASINGAFGRMYKSDEASSRKALAYGRLILVVVNIPFIFIGLQRYSVLSLFLLGNMICVCAFFPVSLGFFKSSPFHPYFRDFIPPTSFLLSLFGTIMFSGVYFDSNDFGAGVSYALWGNTFYEYQYFIAGLVFSVFFTFALLLGVKLVSGPRTLVEEPVSDVSKEDASEIPADVKIAVEEATQAPEEENLEPLKLAESEEVKSENEPEISSKNNQDIDDIEEAPPKPVKNEAEESATSV